MKTKVLIFVIGVFVGVVLSVVVIVSRVSVLTTSTNLPTDLWSSIQSITKASADTFSGRKRHWRCPRLDNSGRGRIPNQRMIDTRPAEVETRVTVGPWEGDLINGVRETGNLVSLVERCTRFTLIDRTDNKNMEVTW